MNRKLKVLGIALAAVFALTAVMASAASAQFTSSASHTTLKGTQNVNHKFTAGSGFGAIECKTAEFHGTQEGTNVSSITITPTYENCSDSFGRVVHIVTNTLHYTFTRVTATTGVVHVSGHIQLTVTASPHCTVTISAQNNVNNITYKNLGGTNGVEVTTNSNNINSTVEGGFFVCGTSTTNATAGTYTGSTVMKGTGAGGVAAAISVD